MIDQRHGRLIVSSKIKFAAKRADIAQVNPKLIKLISMEGHEIASHSLHHSEVIDKSGNPRMSKDNFRKSTKLSKKTLEDLSNKKVIGYRAYIHHIHLLLS